MERLLDEGVPLEDVRRAVAENRIMLLPAERTLTGEPRYTVRQVAERTGIEEEMILAQRQALGMTRPDPESRALTDDDIEAVERIRRFREAGLPDEGMLEVARVIGQAMENVAAVTRQVVGAALLRPGDSEEELARRYEQAAREFSPMMGSLLEYQYRMRLREGLRRDAITPEALESGDLPGGTEVSVAFADLVGFTRLGERLPAADIGRLAGRLAELAADVAEAPVRLVKTIGDAAMLVSRDTRPLLDALLRLVDVAEDEGEDFPQLRAGAARGLALDRGGDWYGRPVNLASRVTDAARPGSVLVAKDVRDAAMNGSDEGEEGDGRDGEETGRYRWSRVRPRHFKGIEGRVALYRVRRREAGDE